MDIDLSNTVGKRAWIKAQEDRVLKQLEQKINIISASLLPPDVSPDIWIYLICIILGTLPLPIIFGLLMSRALKTKNQQDEDKAWCDIAALIAALGPFIYALRIGRVRPKILSLVKPWQIPCGYIHIIDLKPNELRLLLAEAKQVHDIETYRKGAIEIYRYNASETATVETDGAQDKLFESVWPDVTKAVRFALEIHGCSKGKIEKAMSELEAHKSEALTDYAKTMHHIYTAMPEYMRAESELRKSLFRIIPEQAFAYFEESELHRIGRSASDEATRATYFKEWKAFSVPGPETGIQKPDEVLNLYHAKMSLVREVKEYARTRNPHQAYTRYSKNKTGVALLPEATFIDIFKDIGTGRQNAHIAITLTAKDLGIGETSCANHLKQGQANRKINATWLKFFLSPTTATK